MQNTTAPADGTALSDYLQIAQSKACRLAGLLEAIAFLENEGRCSEGQSALIAISRELANELYNNLDCVNWPEVAK